MKLDKALKILNLFKMKKVHLILIIMLSIFCFSCINAQQDKTSTERPTIENKAFNRLLSKMVKEEVPLIGVEKLHSSKEGYLILDAREKEEFEISHIEGAKYIGYDEVDFSAVQDVPKDTPIVIYCSIGVRSEHIGERLEQQGFTNVQNLYGSIFEWANKGYDLVDKSGNRTNKVHAYNWIWGKWMENNTYEKVY